jgi:large subunit ribosomal protein L15
MMLNDVNRGVKKNKSTKRLGRGPGSGQGKTAGRGHKGQGARSGSSFPAHFEGGHSPLIRRVPKRGFNNAFGRTVMSINVGELERFFADGDEVNSETLRAKNQCKGRYDALKILGHGELTKKLKISAHLFSQSALEKIAKAGGTTTVIPGPAPVVKAEKKKVKPSK